MPRSAPPPAAQSAPLVLRLNVGSIVSRNYWRVFIGAAAGLGIVCTVYTDVLGVIPAPRLPSGIAAAAGVALALSLPRRRIWAAAEFHEDGLKLVDLRKQVERIPWGQLRAVVGEGGVSLDGGEIVRWMFVRLVTPRQEFRLRTLEHSAEFFRAVVEHGPRALAVSYAGEIRLPAGARGSIEVSQHAEMVTRFLNRQALRATALALACLMLPAAAATMLAVKGPPATDAERDSLAKSSVMIVALVAAAVALVLLAVKRWWAGRRVAGRIRAAAAGPAAPETPLTIAP